MSGRRARRHEGPRSRVESMPSLSGSAGAAPIRAARVRERWSASVAAHRFAEQRAGDDEALDLAGALVDLRDLGVAVVALGRELLRIAVAAEHLDRLAGLAAGDGAGEQLRLRALDGVRATGFLQARGAPHECPRCLDLGLHIRELLLDGAELGDRPAERVALLGVGGG